jgi:hypothetical protein
MNKLYVLRAVMMETYDCPDNGPTNICERYEDVLFATEREALDANAENLNRGYDRGRWTFPRLQELRALHAKYDEGYKYSVHDVTELLTH